MNKKVFLPIAFFLIIMTVFSSFQTQQDHKVLFEKAKYTMETKADLKEAINLFESLIKTYPNEKEYVAKSLLYQGMCYEKLGNQQAVNKYQLLVKNYPGQKQEVALAKERLSILIQVTDKVSKILPEPKFRKIRTPFNIPQWSGTRLSPDGKIMAFGSGGDVWTVPIPGKVDSDLAGEPKVLSGTSNVLGAGLSWSGDGKRIAFSRVYTNDLRGGGTRIKFNPKGAHIDVLPSIGGEPKRIPVPQWLATNGDTRLQLSLSPDGKLVAFDSGEQIYIASVETGEISQVTIEGGVSPCFSPDGAKISYLKPAGILENPPARLAEVWIISSKGDNAFKVSGDVNRNLSISGPTWSPDGKMIAFCRIDVGEKISSKICIIPLSDEYFPLSAPIQLELPIESPGFITGWTPDNKIGLLLETPYQEYVYTVPLDGGKVNQVSPLNIGASIPCWSPDGKRIYFRWGRGGLASVPSDGGEMKVHDGLEHIRKETGLFLIYPGAGNSVSHDGRSIVFSAGTAKEGPNIYTIPVEGGEVKQVTDEGRYPCWSPDGNWIAYMAYETIGEEKNIAIISKIPGNGGEAIKITSASDFVTAGGFDWSPDGKKIAFFSKKKDTSEGTLNLVQVDGDESKELCQIKNIIGHNNISWSPNGQKIAFISGGKIWVVSAQGGEPEEVKTDVDARAGMLDWSPDGKKIAFSGGSGMKQELWFMEDFLPESKAKQ